MSPLLASLLSALPIALISIIGVIVLAVKTETLNKILLFFVSFSAGSFLGSAFFHLLPEAIEEFGQPIKIFEFTIIGIGLFFLLEGFLRWHHCHQLDCAHNQRQHLGHLNLFGDSLHNAIDGIIIFSAFNASSALGLTVTIAIALHEIPQEIGDFGVLLYAGFKKNKALIYNLLAASTIIIGVIIGYFLTQFIDSLNNFLLPLAAGGFIYLATSDLIPEIHKENNLKRSLFSFVIFAVAVVLMLLLAH